MGFHSAFAAGCVLALSGCPTVDLGDTPPDIGLCNPSRGLAFFQSDIWPKFLHPTTMARDCGQSNACHNASHGLTLDVTTTPVDYPKNYRVAQSYLNCGQPTASLLLTKPLAGIEGHAGGDIFPDLSDAAVVTFKMWFQ